MNPQMSSCGMRSSPPEFEGYDPERHMFMEFPSLVYNLGDLRDGAR
jgi:hypothetical protein